MSSAGDVYENALNNKFELSILNDYEKLAGRNILFVEAALDTVAPADKMMKPLADKLMDLSDKAEYKSIVSGHSFAGQRMKLAETVGQWMEKVIGKGE